MDYLSPSKMVTFITVVGGIPLLLLTNILGFKNVCGVKGLDKTKDGFRNVECNCIGFTQQESHDSFNNSVTTYCTGLNFSNNDLSEIIRIQTSANIDLQLLEASSK